MYHCSQGRLVVKTALKLLLVFVEYTESNAMQLLRAINTVDARRGLKPWANIMAILTEKDGADSELLVYAMTLVNKVEMLHVHTIAYQFQCIHVDAYTHRHMHACTYPMYPKLYPVVHPISTCLYTQTEAFSYSGDSYFWYKKLLSCCHH